MNRRGFFQVFLGGVLAAGLPKAKPALGAAALKDHAASLKRIKAELKEARRAIKESSRAMKKNLGTVRLWHGDTYLGEGQATIEEHEEYGLPGERMEVDINSTHVVSA